MTARTYDLILTVDNANGFNYQDIVYGTTSKAIGVIASIQDNKIKVRLADIAIKFVEETLQKHTTNLIAGDEFQATIRPFTATYPDDYTISASTNITLVEPSPFIAEKNSFTQNPIVRLYSVYMPGNWYPNDEDGYPIGDIPDFKDYGSLDADTLRRPWPHMFPLRFAEIVSDVTDDLGYIVEQAATEYSAIPINITSFDQGSDGKISDLSLTVFNAGGIITRLVEDPYIVGENASFSSVYVEKDGKYINNIDPRTIPTAPEYDLNTVNYYGKTYAPFDYYQTKQLGDTWKSIVRDSRDLHGAMVEITTTFANFLDYWPEYSSVVSYTAGDIADKTDGLVITETMPSGTTNLSGYGSFNTVFSANLIFTVNPVDGLLAEFGSGSSSGMYCGITNSGSTLYIRAGDSTVSTSVSTTNIAVLNITDFPTDGREHTLTWQVNISNGSITAWIDGVNKGTASATNNAFPSNQYSDSDTGTYLTNSTAVPVGALNTPSNLVDTGNGLAIYNNQLVLVGDELTIVEVANNLPYRVGDVVRSSTGNEQGIITAVDGVNLIYIAGVLSNQTTIGSNIYILNPEADADSSLTDVFKIDQLESLGDYVATFGLVSWLQHFKAAIPRRRYLKNTCSWRYKGLECSYDPSVSGYFTIANEVGDVNSDNCSKSYAACKLRNNQSNFGAFPGVGRTIPRG